MALFEYQQIGVNWLVKRESSLPAGGFLCDEMGLGKTIQMIQLMSSNKCKSTLVVVPNSLVHQWMSEIEKFSDLKKCIKELKEMI